MTQARGIDVSHWQDRTPDLSGLDFLFARASVGLQVDRKYQMHIANARAAGLIVGAYHFGYNNISIEGQARTFLAAAGDVDFYFLDVEAKTAPTRQQSQEFFSLVHAAGKKVGLYHSESGFFEAGQDYDWVANWSATPSRHWEFHQYRGSPLDLNRFNGTAGELRAFSGKEEPMRNFTLLYDADGRVITGTLTVHGDDHMYLRLSDGALRPASSSWRKQAIKVRLTENITSKPHPGVDRRTGYLVGDNAAFLLATDVDFTPYPDKSVKELADAKAALAVSAGKIAAAKTALA